MILNGAVPGNGHEFLWGELRHEGHDADVGAGLLHCAGGIGIAQRFKLMHGQPSLLRRHAQRIRAGAFFFGGAEHRHRLVAARQKRFQYSFAEILLPDDRDLHRAPTSAGLAGMEKAPASFLVAIWASLQPSTSLRISSVCSPSSGERSILAGDAESLIGMPTLYHLPRWG